jgi:hypothetical protein
MGTKEIVIKVEFRDAHLYETGLSGQLTKKILEEVRAGSVSGVVNAWWVPNYSDFHTKISAGYSVEVVDTGVDDHPYKHEKNPYDVSPWD